LFFRGFFGPLAFDIPPVLAVLVDLDNPTTSLATHGGGSGNEDEAKNVGGGGGRGPGIGGGGILCISVSTSIFIPVSMSSKQSCICGSFLFLALGRTFLGLKGGDDDGPSTSKPLPGLQRTAIGG
jgi:hypothetical protein